MRYLIETDLTRKEAVMSIPRHIKEYLDSTHVSYRHAIHSPAYTAQETAHERT